MDKPDKEQLLLVATLPAFANELQELLIEGEPDLAAQVPSLSIFDRCRCGDDICCGTFYTKPKPNGAYGPGHRNVVLSPSEGMLILDVLDGEIACVEVLDRAEVREKLLAVLP